jgi:hypothetical protein
MEFTQTGPFGPNGATGDQVMRLNYTDRTHFKLTVLAHPGGADVAGRSWTFDGDKVIIFRPPNSTTTGTSPGPDGGAVPDDWIIPGPAPVQATQQGAQITRNADGTATAVQTRGGTRLTIRYRQADGIPLAMSEMEGSKVTRRAEVTRLEIKRP